MSVEVDQSSAEGLVFHTSGGQDLITALLGSWMTIGGFVDGFAHRNLDTPETFFTPWHGVLYTGYLASSIWVVWLLARNRDRAPSPVGAIPVGYGVTVAGLAVFAAGGIGDLIWHTLFGIEVSIDALLSPTHIMLLLGAILIVAGPLRARWWDDGYQPDRLAAFLPPLVAVTAAAAEVGFFFQYVDGLSSRFMQATYEPGPENGYFEVVAGLSSMLITTVILMGALLLLMRRWRLPPGSALFLFGAFGLLMELLEGYEFPEDVIAPIVAGLFAEMVLRYLYRGSPAAIRITAFIVPLVMWGVRFGVFERYADINWPVSVWTGSLVFTGLTAVGLSLLAFPPTRDGDNRLGSAASDR